MQDTIRKAVFIDKDGTLLVNEPFNVEMRKIVFAPGAGEAMQALHKAGYLIVVVSNQAGVALGHFPEESLADVENHIKATLARWGVPLAGFYYCPHHPDGVVPAFAVECRCRKPRDGMLRRAADELGVSLALSWMIGDILDDMEAGRRAGCRTIMVGDTHETEWRLTPERMPYMRVHGLREAADMVIAADISLLAGKDDTALNANVSPFI